MLRASLLVLVIALTIPAGASAQNAVHDLRAEVMAITADRQARFGRQGAGAFIVDALEGMSVDPGTAFIWGGWMAFEFSYMAEFYDAADRELLHWALAVSRGDVTEAEALAILSGPMRAFHEVDRSIVGGMTRALQHTHARGMHFSQALDVWNVFDDATCPPYAYQMHLADVQWNLAYSALPVAVRTLRVIPPFEGEAPTLEGQLRARLPTRDMSPGALAARLTELSFLLVAGGVPPEDGLPQLVGLVADQAAAQPHLDYAIAVMTHAATLPEAERVEVLRLAEAQVLQRAGAVLPIYAAALQSRGPLRAEDLALIQNFAVRLEQLRNDIDDPIGPASPMLRALSGLRAAVSILQTVEGNSAEAARILSVASDIAAASSRYPTPVAAIAVPGGIVAGHADWIVGTTGLLSDTLASLSEAMQSGDPDALARTVALSRDVQRAIHPRAILERWIGGGAGGFVSNLPFARAFADELLASLLPPGETEVVTDFTARPWLARCSN